VHNRVKWKLLIKLKVWRGLRHSIASLTWTVLLFMAGHMVCSPHHFMYSECDTVNFIYTEKVFVIVRMIFFLFLVSMQLKLNRQNKLDLWSFLQNIDKPAPELSVAVDFCVTSECTAHPPTQCWPCRHVHWLTCWLAILQELYTVGEQINGDLVHPDILRLPVTVLSINPDFQPAPE